jgi:hypothetical protein
MWKEKIHDLYSAPRLRSFVVIFVLSFIFFSPFFIEGKVFLAADTLFLHWPWKNYAPQNFLPHNTLITDPVNSSYAELYNRGLKDSHVSRWSPYVLTGIPGIMGGAGPYFPVKMLLHRLFTTPVALTLFLFIHVTLMGYFMFLYLYEIGAGWRGALFGAVAYMFNGCVMVWLEFEMWVTAGAYLPLLLFCMERYLGRKRFLYAFAGGIVFGTMLLNSAFQLTVYIAVFMIFYSVFLIARYYRNGNWRGVASIGVCLLITGITGLLIGAIEILPFFEAARHSSRISRTFEFHQFFDTLSKVPLRWFITLFFPDYFGSPVLHFNPIPALPSQEYMNYNELTLYAGIPTVFAFAGCIVARKNSFSRFYLFMTALVITMLTGTYAYYPFFKLVPGMNKMNPSRLIFLFVFMVSAASGLFMKALEDMTPRMKKIFLVISLGIAGVVVLISFFGSSPGIIRWFNKENFETASEPVAAWLAPAIRDLRSIHSPVVYKPLILTLAAFCLFSVLAITKKNKTRDIVFILILAVLSYDLISFGRNYNSTASPEYVYMKTPSIEYLMRQPGPFRVVQDADSDLLVNTLIPFGIEEVGGYMNVYPERVNKLMSYIQYGDRAFDGNIFDRWVTFGGARTDFSLPIFDLMNVRYLLTAPGLKVPFEKYKLVFQGDMSIYENMRVMPRAYIVHNCVVTDDVHQTLRFMWSDQFDMRSQVMLEKEPSMEFAAGITSPAYPSTARIDTYTPDEVHISADLGANGWLVLSDTYYPGWIAEVDGKESPIQRANVNFRAVELKQGKHYISFRYEPSSVRTGMILSALGILVCAFGIWISGRHGKRNFGVDLHSNEQ